MVNGNDLLEYEQENIEQLEREFSIENDLSEYVLVNREDVFNEFKENLIDEWNEHVMDSFNNSQTRGE